MALSLSNEQTALFIAIVDADRSVPRSERHPFFAFSHVASYNLLFNHRGLPENFEAYPNDLIALGRLGLLEVRNERPGAYSFDITNRGYAAYDELIGGKSAPVPAVESAFHRLIDSAAFRRRHPKAYELWAEAAELLWSPDGDRHLTKIGHLCREASQEFAESLLRVRLVPDVTTDKARVKQRVQAVLESLASSDTTRSLLIAVHAYWCSCVDLIQRQEHGATKEGARLEWEDGRLVVFGALVAMAEIDRAVVRPQSA